MGYKWKFHCGIRDLINLRLFFSFPLFSITKELTNKRNRKSRDTIQSFSIKLILIRHSAATINLHNYF